MTELKDRLNKMNRLYHPNNSNRGAIEASTYNPKNKPN